MKYFLTFVVAGILLSCTALTKSPYSKIEYEAGACFGFCPIFKIVISPDRTAVIEAEHFTFTTTEGRGYDPNLPKEGTFKTTLKQADYDKLISLLNGLDIKTLKKFYGSKNTSDLPTSYLRITFADGTKKEIEDYGKGGTEKLNQLYQFIENLRKSQSWTKVN